MITFNELRITGDGKELIINASIKYLIEFPNAYISQLIVNSGDTYNTEEPLYTKSYPTDQQAIIEKLTEVDLKDITLNRNIILVSVVVSGLPDDYNECTYGSSVGIGVAVNLYPFYQRTMNFFKEMSNNCDLPENLIDMYLRLKALELAIITGNFSQAIEYWNDNFMSTNPVWLPCKCRENG